MIRPTATIFLAGFTLLAIACTTETTTTAGTPAPAPSDTTGTEPGPGTGTPGTTKPGSTTTPDSCVTDVTNATARSPKPSRGRKPDSCTAKEIEMIFDPSLSYTDLKPLLSADCAACATSEQSDATWGATVRVGEGALINLSGCLRAKGESGTCADAFDVLQLCEVDSCAKCTDKKEREACTDEVSAKGGTCLSLSKVKAAQGSCSEGAEANINLCNSTASVEYMCGGKVDPLGCSTTTQVGADVVGVVGTVVPTFTGGTIANGTWVATKVEGFGSGFPASVVGTTTRGTLTISGASYETIGYSSTDGKTKTAKGTQSVAGTKVTQTQTCPSAQTLPQSFTATPTTLVMGFGFTASAPSSGIVITYTKK